MALDYYIVLYIDILGFSRMVKNDCENISDNKYFEKLKESFFFIKGKFGTDVEMKQFSDSIIVSIPLKPSRQEEFIKIIDIARNIQIEMFKKEILSRGGMSFGKHFSENDFIFSDALINAYNLEKDHAKNPRIIISQDLLSLFEIENLLVSERKIIKEDDGRYFVNYINLINIDECNKVLNSIFPNGSEYDYSIAEKYRWLYEYASFYFGNDLEIKNDRFI